MTKKFYLILLALLGASYSFSQDFDGFALYNQGNSNTAYLIDSEGDIAHVWSCDEAANYALALKDNGNLVRGAKYDNNQIDGAAIGGLIQEIDPAGDVVWEFIYSSPTYISHHDIALMPNGNVLMIAWEYISEEDLEDVGYTGNDGDKYSTHIIEVQQDDDGGQLVWSWHLKDHFVQDVDANLPNYGEISEHPELLDINVDTDSGGGPPGGGPDDWFHCNGIDYNEALDQIVFSSRFLNEIFIIDHSTNTVEAAGHTGGNSGKGGDFLYRWGKPANYGINSPQIIPGPVHDSRWIPEDRPNGGFIQVFNNEGNNGSSSIDAIDAPVDGWVYEYTEGEAFEPTSYSWRHDCLDNAAGQSASDRMSNGNVFVNLSGGFGGAGYMYEATEDGDMIWQYNADSEKGFRVECDHPGLMALFGFDPCEETVGTGDIEELAITVFPNPSTGQFSIIGEFGLGGLDQIVVHDALGREVLRSSQNQRFDLSDEPNGVYFVTGIYGGKTNTRMVNVAR